MANSGESSRELLSYDDAADSKMTGWAAQTFHDVEEAQIALANEREAFLERKDIMILLPQDIRRHLYFKGDNAQVKAFQDLFVHLGRSSTTDDLHKKVSGFFSATPALKSRLKFKPERKE